MSINTIANINLAIIHCCDCGIPFAVTKSFKDRRLEDGEDFYCPSGHQQYFTRRKKLEDEIKDLEENRDYYKNRMYHYQEENQHKEYQRRGYKAALTRTKNALARGQCPCCGDQFSDLKSHMDEKHPNYKPKVENAEQ